MLISYKHQFIFVHVFKTAGISIFNALEPYTRHPNETRSTRIGKRLKLLKGNDDFEFHATAREIKANLDAKYYDEFFKFAFVRNPWDWMVSLYFYNYKKQADNPAQLMARSFQSFDDWLIWKTENNKKEKKEKDYITDDKLQKDFLTDRQGNLLVDYVGKFETLETSFAEICSKIGVSVTLPMTNKTSHKHYKEYYNGKTIDMVHQLCKDDIDLFNYEY